MKQSPLNRRDFSKLTMAAFGGMVAGATAGATRAFSAQEAADEKKEVKKEIHVCRGLNTCKGNGIKGKNECAGQGTCATAKAHTCHTFNDCKTQGGCGEKPGENDCKGKGSCGVPLSDKTWKIARTRFEAWMTKAKKKFGAAPKKEKKKDA